VTTHNTNEPHLAEDDMLKAVIDDTDLSPLQQQHLAQCSRCQSRQGAPRKLNSTHLGQLAERYGPATAEAHSRGGRQSQIGFS